MPGFSGVSVDAPGGQRWELALGIIDSGEASVRLGEVEICRATAGPEADGIVHLIVTVAERADQRVAKAAVLRARQVTQEVALADPRFARLLDQYGYRWEVVSNYGMGTILLGEANGDGELVWHR